MQIKKLYFYNYLLIIFLQVNLALDEEVLQFDSISGPETWSFIIPKKRSRFNIFFHPFIAGILAGAVVYYNRPSSLMSLGLVSIICFIYFINFIDLGIRVILVVKLLRTFILLSL